MVNLIGKKDFIESVRASMSLDAIKTAQDAPLDTNERFRLVILTVKVWSNTQRQETHNHLYQYFHSVANWMDNAHASIELSAEETAMLNRCGIDPLLELIWECVQNARGDMGEVLMFLHEFLRLNKPL